MHDATNVQRWVLSRISEEHLTGTHSRHENIRLQMFTIILPMTASAAIMRHDFIDSILKIHATRSSRVFPAVCLGRSGYFILDLIEHPPSEPTTRRRLLAPAFAEANKF